MRVRGADVGSRLRLRPPPILKRERARRFGRLRRRSAHAPWGATVPAPTPRIRLAARSAIIMTAGWMFELGTSGITDASATRRPRTPPVPGVAPIAAAGGPPDYDVASWAG